MQFLASFFSFHFILERDIFFHTIVVMDDGSNVSGGFSLCHVCFAALISYHLQSK